MRMRKKPWAKDMIASRTDCVISEQEKMAGHWSQFSRSGEVRVEIGSGKGDYWINMAHLYPEAAFIAIEKNTDCAAISLKKCLDNTSDNMKLIVDDASKIETWFNENEIDVIHLNFSDPWPKKGHTKRRLTYRSFLDSYKRILKPDGKIVMKTDNMKLFEYSLVSFSNSDWYLREVSVDYRRDEHPEDVITEYESNFMALGQPIYRAVWQLTKEEEN